MAELLVNSVIPITGGSYSLATPTSPGVLYVEVAAIPGESVSLTSSGYDTNLSAYYDSSGTLIYRAEIPYYQSTPISVSISGASEVYYGTSTYYTPTSYPSGSYVSADPPPPVGSNDYQAWYDRNFPEEPEAPPTPSLSTVTGTVTDQNGNPLEATIICRNRSTDAVVGSTTSDPSTGEYSVGCYTINEHYLIAIYNETQVKIKDRIISDGSNNAWDFSGVEVEGFLSGLPSPHQYFVKSSYYIDPTGTKLFVGRRTNIIDQTLTLVEYAMLTPWEVDTIYYVGTFDTGVTVASVDEPAFAFSNDGTKMYFANPSNGRILQYDLSTAWDLSTAIFSNRWLTGRYTSDDNFRKIQISPDGLHFLVCENAYMDHYLLATAWTLPLNGVNATPDSIIGPSFTYSLYSSFIIGNNPRVYYGHSSDIYDFTNAVGLNTAWDFADGAFLLPDDERIYYPFMSYIRDVFVDSTGTKGIVMAGSTLSSVTFGTAFDLNTIQLKQNTYITPNKERSVNLVYFNNTGTKCFIATDNGSSDEDLIFYNLSTPWDISTTTEYGRIGTSVGLSNLEIFNMQQCFSPDEGKTLFFASYDRISCIKLGTAWDPTTYQSVTDKIINDYDPLGIALNSDGTKVFISDRYQAIGVYTLNTPYDISTLDYGSLTEFVCVRASNDGYNMNIHFTNNGRTLRVVIDEYNSTRNAQHTLDEYTLTTPYDLTTATYVGYTVLPYRNNNEYSEICITPDGKHMYACYGIGIIQFDA